MGTLLSIDEIRNTVAEIGERYGVDRIFLFGSYARGDANEDSDVDLRVDRGSVRGLGMAGLLLDIQESLGKKVDLLSTKSLESDFLSKIRNEEILLYERRR